MIDKLKQVVWDRIEENWDAQMAFRGEGGGRRPVLNALTDARFWVVHPNRPATCYGPAGAGLHSADEWVDLASVKEVTKVIAALALDSCSVAWGA